MALPVEYSTRFNHQTRRVDFARDHALCLDLDPAFCKNNTVEFSGNHHMIPFDLSFDARAFTQDQAVGGNHIAFNLAVDAKHAGSFESAFELYSLIEKTGKFVVLRVFTALL